MKICNIGHARSRTTYLTQHLSKYYKINNFNEVYSNCKTTDSLQTLRKNIKLFTQNIFDKNNFIIKVWPRYFSVGDSTNVTFISDLNDCFKFSDYDKIIITFREPVDSLCSLSTAELFGYNFNEENKLKESLKNRYTKKITVNLENSSNKLFLIEIFLIPYIVKYLNKMQISYTMLEYNSIPQYLQSFELQDDLNFISKNSIPTVLDSKTSYKLCINNYNEVQDFVYKYKEEIQPFLDSIILR